MCAGAEVGGPAVEAVYRPMVLGEWSSGRLLAPECPHPSLGKASPPCPSFPIRFCAGVWDQKWSGAGESVGLWPQAWASEPPRHDQTSMEGTLSLAPVGRTGIRWGHQGVATANLPSLSSGPDLPGCVLATGPQGGAAPLAWVPLCVLGPLGSTNAACGPAACCPKVNA